MANPEIRADAEFIVRAVNSHAELIAALKYIVRGKQSLTNSELVQDFQATARFALAKAEGRS